jgi:phage terminase large subunit
MTVDHTPEPIVLSMERNPYRVLGVLFKEWKDNPLGFVETALGVERLEPWQAKVLGDIGGGIERLSIRSGHGVGKTALLSWVVLWFLCTHFPCKAACTAPTSHQLRDVLWPEIALWLDRLNRRLRDNYKLSALRVVMAGATERAFAVGRTARPERPEGLQGFHSENTLFVVDEASGVDDRIFDVALGAMSTEHAITVLAGNPTRLSGFFYDTHGRLSHRWRCHHVSSSEVSRARGHMADIEARYGKDSNSYRVRVLGEFPTEEADTVIKRTLCDDAIARAGVVGPIENLAPIWGVDVARFGSDRSALAKRQGNVLLEPVQWWRGLDTMQTAGRILEQWRQTPQDLRPARILVDVVGLGAGVADRLRELGLPVTGVNVGANAVESDKYARLRDELWFSGRRWLEAGDSILPADLELVAELTVVQFNYTSSGKSVVESKDEMKRRGLPSPDLADAFLLTFAAGDHRRERPQARGSYRRDRARGGAPGSWMAV